MLRNCSLSILRNENRFASEEEHVDEATLTTESAIARLPETSALRRCLERLDAPRRAGEALWRRIEAAVRCRPREEALLSRAWSRWWSNVAAWRAVAFAASIGMLVLAVGLGFAIRAARQQPTMIAVLLDGNRAGAVVHAFADGRVVLVPITSINVPAGRALQVWTLPSRERGPVSVGLMSEARTLQLSLKD